MPTHHPAITLALAHHRAGEFAEAQRLCRQVLAITPGDVDALHLLGVVLAATQEHDAAIASYRAALAIQPNRADLHNNLGASLAAKGLHEEAIAFYRDALRLGPDYADAMINLGASLAATRQVDDAIAIYRDVLKLNPNLASAHNNLGAALAARQQFDEAIAEYREAIRLDPEYAGAHSNLGVAYWEMNRQEDALQAYREAIRVNPGHAESHNNLGNYFLGIFRVDEAIAAFREALRLKPGMVDALCNLGIALMENGEYEGAGVVYEEALRLSPHGTEPHWNIACYSLLLGDFRRGWLEYEWRWRTRASSTPRRNFPQPTWCGEPLEGRTLLLYTEQGYGDSIQFIRYATRAARAGGRVILHCQRELARLMQGVAGIEQIVTNEELPPFDLYCPLMTLPLVFGTLLETIPAEAPYIQVDGELAKAWGEKARQAGNSVGTRQAPDVGRALPAIIPGGGQCPPYTERPVSSVGSALRTADRGQQEMVRSADPTHLKERPSPQPSPGVPGEGAERTQNLAPLKVGLVWAGGAAYRNDRKRSVSLAQLAPLANVANTRFFSLQKGEAAAQAAHPPAGIDLIDFSADLLDFADTAALIAHLDLVIAVDTSVAHLAGALGKPVWLLLPTNPDWRWMLNRDDSPWYPTMRLFRQTTRGQWTDVIQRVAEALAGLRDVPTARPIAPEANAAPRRLSTVDAIALAYQHHQAGRYSEAAGIYREILAQQPRNTDVLHLMGLAALDAQRPDVAAEWIRRAIAVNPSISEFHHNLGRALSAAGRFEPAIDAYRNAIGLNPALPDVYYNLGNALLKTKQFTEAIDAYRTALQHRPDHFESSINLGAALVETLQFDAALAGFADALRLQPNHADTRVNIAMILMAQRKFEEAAAILREAIALDRECAEAHWLLGALSLLRGDFEQGWKEYEWRFRRKDATKTSREFSQPRWDGKGLNGRTILLHAEQGFGDTIQFIRYAPLVAERGGRVIVESPSQLSQLVRTVRGVEEVFPVGGAPHFDVQCPLMSLPLAFGTRLDTIPAEAPYFHLDPGLRETWARRVLARPAQHIGPLEKDQCPSEPGRVAPVVPKARVRTFGSTGLTEPGSENYPRVAGTCTKGDAPSARTRRIGLAWAGRPAFQDDHKRSITLLQLAPLAGIQNLVFYSLQKGPASAQTAQPPQGMKLIDLTPDLNDFTDTAGVILALDLVIAVDTAVAHLAGALGKPVWLLLPFDPDFRWMLDRDDSPWYPTMRLFRQTTRGDWTEVIERIASSLGAVVSAEERSRR